MSTYRLLGLESLAIGAYPTTGTIATSFTTISNIVPGSANFAISTANKTKHYVEESDFPDMMSIDPADMVIEWATRDMDVENAEFAFGGTGSGTVFTAPQTALGLREYSIRMISKAVNGKKIQLEITRSALIGNADLRFAKDEPGQIGYNCEVLNPTTVTFPWRKTILTA